jgi:hypothetical protein
MAQKQEDKTEGMPEGTKQGWRDQTTDCNFLSLFLRGLREEEIGVPKKKTWEWSGLLQVSTRFDM